jgi:hypothetical protein
MTKENLQQLAKDAAAETAALVAIVEILAKLDDDQVERILEKLAE